MTHYSAKDDVQLACTSVNKKDIRKEQARRRLSEYVFRGRKDELGARLDEVFGWLEMVYRQNQQTGSTVNRIIHDIVERFYAEKLFDILLERFPLDDIEQELERVQVDPRISDCHAIARHRFQREFCAYVGESFERSMSFALHLLEHIGQSSRRICNRHEKREPQSIADEDLATASLYFILTSAAHPVHQEYAIKRWLERLIEYVATSIAASEVFGSIFALLGTGYPGCAVPLYCATGAVIPPSSQITGESLLNAPYLLLSARHYSIVKRWTNSLSEMAKKAYAKGVDVLNSMVENRERLIAYNERCEQKVREAPSCWLRPGGFDHVDIHVTPLRNAGVRSIVFHPEGYVFPDTGVEVIVRKETPHLISFRTTISDMMALDDEVFENHFHDTKSLRVLLVVVAIDVLSRIVLSEKPLREKKHTASKENKVKGIAHPVRPHIRQLPFGQVASEEAQARWRELYASSLPDRVTFVRAHFSHGQIVYDLPTTAFATYGDEDFFDLGGADGSLAG